MSNLYYLEVSVCTIVKVLKNFISYFVFFNVTTIYLHNMINSASYYFLHYFESFGTLNCNPSFNLFSYEIKIVSEQESKNFPINPRKEI